MAEVWRGTLEGPMGYTKEVALKRLPARLTDDDAFVQALVNEARIGGQLRHPNIVEVFELEHEGGEWFIAMELIRGKSLADILGQCRNTGATLPRSVTIEIAMQVLAGLQYAHSFRTKDGEHAQLVHRDLKPSNVMISERGVAKIMDFGLARSRLNYFRSATGQSLKGTPLYMSPEQVNGESLTPASDLFSFGAILFEMLTNRRLFLGDDLYSVFARIVQVDLTPHLQPLREQEPVLGAVVARCLQRDIEARLGSERALHERLRAEQHADPSKLTLNEFCFYLQRAPSAGLVTVDDENTWRWISETDVGDDGDRSVSVPRPLQEISDEVEAFGAAFFGPDRCIEGERVLDSSAVDARAEDPTEAFDYSSDEAPAPAPSSETTAAPADPGVQSAETIDYWAGRTKQPGEPPPDGQPSDERPHVRTPLHPAWIAVVVFAALAAGFVWWASQRGEPGLPPQEALARFNDALSQGDAEGAADAIAKLEPGGEETPAGMLLIASNAAMAGWASRAAPMLADTESWPEPERSRAHLLSAGLHRVDGPDYAAAAADYGRCLDCDGADCADIVAAAQRGLTVSCLLSDAPLPPECGQIALQVFSSDAERSLVASVLLHDDGHAVSARQHLESGLDGLSEGQSVGCGGLEALRLWAREPELAPALVARVSTAGREVARGDEDCLLFEETELP